MGKNLYIAEKPSVAKEFAKVLNVSGSGSNGYVESNDSIVTWCVGHLVTMSYPEVYDASLKRWTMETLPFFPKNFSSENLEARKEEWKYEVIESVKKQFQVVSKLLTRKDVDCIYVCTDSGREGEYIYRLVDQMVNVENKAKKRVWIDSQTEEEIKRGIREAKDLSEYDNLSASAYLRAKEDYLMGINFSRVLTLKFGPMISAQLHSNKNTVISVGRVMTCVLGMIVRREREIRSFVKTPFYRILGDFSLGEHTFTGEWKAVEGTKYFNSPWLYKENGFKEKEKAQELVDTLLQNPPLETIVASISRKKEKKNAPLLYNLAELQNECSKRFKINPDQTLKIVQELYEKKLVTYPRTDARVLSTAVAKEIKKNISGLVRYETVRPFAEEILEKNWQSGLLKSKYVNDKQITDHYAIIPTGQGMQNLRNLSGLSFAVYECICRRFLSIFYPPAVYQKYSLDLERCGEHFFSNFRILLEEGYLKVTSLPKKEENKEEQKETEQKGTEQPILEENQEQDIQNDVAFMELLNKVRKGTKLSALDFYIREGETTPPKRYHTGSMILAMENAGQLIEDEELRAQIKGSGIGTSATRAEILKKLVTIGYIKLNAKTQIITPSQLGEMVHDVVYASMRQMLNPDLTASWEKGLSYVAEGSITSDEYMEKLEKFIAVRTVGVKNFSNQEWIRQQLAQIPKE